jgi:hypothetical protein
MLNLKSSLEFEQEILHSFFRRDVSKIPGDIAISFEEGLAKASKMKS